MPAVDAELLQTAVGWTQQAGALTLEWFNHPELAIDAKGDGTPVTQADRAAERLLRELISDAFPLDGIQGEEEAARVGSSGRGWVIDPIDGTKAFTHGVGTYSNLLYLEDEHGPAIGVINLPALGETIYAARGLGCFMNGVPCRVSARDQLEGSYVACTEFYMWTAEMFSKVSAAGAHLRTWGDAYGYALVATGRIEAMMDPAFSWWDIAPLTVIIPEAGGVLTARNGSRSFNMDGTDDRSITGVYSAIASNGLLHEQIVDLLRP
ncbi:MAG: inositol monophosphatase family protein [Actinomycetes bacterium]